MGDNLRRAKSILLSCPTSWSMRAEVLVRGPLAKVKANGCRSFRARQKSLSSDVHSQKHTPL
jgi:hypothetical protein